METKALRILFALAIGITLSGCGGEPPVIKVSYPGVDLGATFRLENATDREWSDVHVVLQALRPDAVGDRCAEQRFELWPPGTQQSFTRCPGDRTLIVIETEGASARFVLDGDQLFQKFGRKEIPVS
jgi:hypothetical protein